MSFLATVQNFVSVNQVLVMNGLVVTLILLQVGLLVNAFLNEPASAEYSEHERAEGAIDVVEMYGYHRFHPWVF